MRSLLTATLFTLCFVACTANDPVYIPAPMTMEGGFDDGSGGTTVANASLVLPINTETPDDAAKRTARTAALGIDVPYVKVGDIEVSIEYTIHNLDTMMEGDALVQLNGANEVFIYDPTMIMLSNDDEAPPTPGLDGDIPIHVPAGGTVTGLFREDQLLEASIDLDAITRANVNPFRATLTINKNDKEIQPMLPFDPMMPDVAPGPDLSMPPIPREAFRQMVRIDLVFKPNRHMVLEFNVRVRDVRGIMNDKLLSAPMGELQTFMFMPFALMAAPGA